MFKKIAGFFPFKTGGSENGFKQGVGKSFIFHDTSGRRWPLSVSLFVVFTLVMTIIAGVIFSSLFNTPDIKPVNLGRDIEAINEPLKNENIASPAFTAALPDGQSSISTKEVYGYYTQKDTSSLASLKGHIESMDVVMPDWYYISSDQTIKVKAQEKIDALADKENVKVLPKIQLENPEDLQMLESILASEDSRKKLAEDIHEQVKENQYSGINIDFTDLDETSKSSFTLFVKEINSLFQKDGLEVTLAANPAGGLYDFAALSAVVDRIIVRMYDEHYQAGKPGPIASIGWTEQMLNDLSIPAEKLVVSIGSFGYDWNESSSKPATFVTFEEIMKMASEENLQVQWDEKSRNPYLRYTENGENHIIWFLDGVTAYNQLKLSFDNGIHGIAIHSLGQEEEVIWDLLKEEENLVHQAANLEKVENLVPLSNVGSGEIIKYTEDVSNGARKYKVDNNGFVISQNYLEYPNHYFTERYGHSAEKKIAITFDDGPHPAYTPEILDILSEKSVPATFFVLGKQVARYPEITERMHREGHDIGNHTFSHINIEESGSLMLEAELNATQWLIQQTTGHATKLFRPPYTTDADYPVDELNPILTAQDMGYNMVGSLIDSRDWDVKTSEEIVENVKKRVEEGRGNILLLHDAGADRSPTVEALPKIIDQLRKEGYTFVTVSSLMGKPKAEVMPPVGNETSLYMFFYKLGTGIYISLANFSLIFFSGAIIFGIARILFLLYFSNRHRKNYQKRKRSLNPNSDYKPLVTVIIPSYNEEKVIEGTVKSILKSDYSNFEILVVDDGSTDHTAEVVQNAFGYTKQVKLISKRNGGKSSAINCGFQEANGEIVLILDADTSIARDSISLLAAYFEDENVGAVSGNVKIGNVNNLLTLWQHVEYVTGFNLEKRAFDEINAITVVPGAIGAWRKSAIEEVGFFEEDTLAEDTDITLKILRKGYRIKYEPHAYAYTEAPEDVKTFIKQRFRWSYGILQCLWKHRGALFNRKQKSLGFLGLPNMWSQYALQSLAPLADIVFLIGLFGDTPKIVAFYAAFLVMDTLVAYYSFKLEKISAKPLYLLFLQRFFYRQLLTYTIWKSFIFSLKGVMVGWNKFERSGNVEVPRENILNEAKKQGA